MTLLGGDPIDLGGRGVGVQEAVHDGDAPGVYCDLVVLNCLVVTHRPIFELIIVNLQTHLEYLHLMLRLIALLVASPWLLCARQVYAPLFFFFTP